MKKLLLYMIICLGIISLVGAGTLAVSLLTKNAEIDTKLINNKIEGDINYLCDGNPQIIHINISNRYKDNILRIDEITLKLILNDCQGTATEIRDWTGRIMKELNEIYSFDETKLKNIACNSKGSYYDDKTENCIEVINIGTGFND